MINPMQCIQCLPSKIAWFQQVVCLEGKSRPIGPRPPWVSTTKVTFTLAMALTGCKLGSYPLSFLELSRGVNRL